LLFTWPWSGGSLDAAKEIIFVKEEELAAAEDVRQERDVLAQMVRTLQDREQASGGACQIFIHSSSTQFCAGS